VTSRGDFVLPRDLASSRVLRMTNVAIDTESSSEYVHQQFASSQEEMLSQV
jgi:hypothetical protein